MFGVMQVVNYSAQHNNNVLKLFRLMVQSCAKVALTSGNIHHPGWHNPGWHIHHPGWLGKQQPRQLLPVTSPAYMETTNTICQS